MTSPASISEPVTREQPPAAQSSTATKAERRPPTRWQSICLFVRADLAAMARSWLCRGFFLASVVITVLELKGMQAGQKAASQMLEAVYATYLLVWMHGVIFLSLIHISEPTRRTP